MYRYDPDNTGASDDPTRPAIFKDAARWLEICKAFKFPRSERQAVGFLVQGKTDTQIAKALGIKRTSVKSTLKNARLRAKAPSRSALSYCIFASYFGDDGKTPASS